MKLLGVILAGGEGRRMGGRDKAFLPLAGRPLVSHVIERIRPQVAELAISANGDPARFSPFALPVLADEVPMGPLSGILAGLRHAREIGAGAVLSVPVDLPFVPTDIAARLAGHSLPVHAAAGGREHYTVALWPVALAGPLAAFLASGAKPRIRDFAAMHGGRALEFADPSAFANLNGPEELAAAEARLSGHETGCGEARR